LVDLLEFFSSFSQHFFISHIISPTDLLHPPPAPPKPKAYKSTDDQILNAQFLTQIWKFLYETKHAAISLISYRPTLLRSRNNSVDNAARLLARRSSNFGSILGSGNRYFFSPKLPDRHWDALSFLFGGYQGLFLRGKAAGAWSWPLPYKVNYTPPSYTAIPPIRLHGFDRGEFTFSYVL